MSPDIKGLGAEAKTIEDVAEAMESGALEFVRLDLFGADKGGKTDLKPTGILLRCAVA